MTSTKTISVINQNLDSDTILLDVRSPGEYQSGHISGAINLPLFTDSERAIVGTLFKQASAEDAYLRGLEIAGIKMRQYVEKANELVPSKKALLYCWRGGKRSESMGWLLKQTGFDIKVLQGGYKRFRNDLFDFFEKTSFKFIVISGKTGSGKTEILKHLCEIGEQVIDLEAIANHKGSAFGALGMDDQPSTEQFENNLLHKLTALDTTKRVFIEDESKMIGTCHVPNMIHAHMKNYAQLTVELPYEVRVERLVHEYGHFPKEILAAKFSILESKLGNLQMRTAIEEINSGNLANAVAIALQFYDKAYQHHLSLHINKTTLNLKRDHDDPKMAAMEVIELCNKFSL